jgi:hypothetical protein
MKRFWMMIEPAMPFVLPQVVLSAISNVAAYPSPSG